MYKSLPERRFHWRSWWYCSTHHIDSRGRNPRTRTGTVGRPLQQCDSTSSLSHDCSNSWWLHWILWSLLLWHCLKCLKLRSSDLERFLPKRTLCRSSGSYCVEICWGNQPLIASRNQWNSENSPLRTRHDESSWKSRQARWIEVGLLHLNILRTRESNLC